MVKIKRGEIWWAGLDIPSGSGPGFRRPVLVIQTNEFNESRISTVIVAAISSNMKLARAPGNVALSKKESGLSKESVINVSQIVTIDKSTLTEKVSRLSDRLIRAADTGIRLVLSLE